MTAAIAPSTRVIVAALAGMIAAWLAAGSIGLLAHPLRHALVWLAMAAVLLAGWPRAGDGGRGTGDGARGTGTTPRGASHPPQPASRLPPPAPFLTLAAALLAGLILTVPATGAYNVLGVALVLAVLAQTHTGLDQRALVIVAFAVAVLGVFRVACTTIAAAWQVADWLGCVLGTVASAISGRPLWVGATLGGVDFLVLMIAFCGAWLFWTVPPRWARAAYALAAVLVGHLGYLVLLSYSTDLANALPVHRPPEPPIYVPPPWFLSDAVRTLLPWDVPAVAAVIQVAIAACMFRWGKQLSVVTCQLSRRQSDRPTSSN